MMNLRASNVAVFCSFIAHAFLFPEACRAQEILQYPSMSRNNIFSIVLPLQIQKFLRLVAFRFR